MSCAPDPGQWAGFLACAVAYVLLAIRWRRDARRRSGR